MLVFKMDTTNLFKYGQKHEIRISLPRDKHKSKPSNGYRRGSTSCDRLTGHHHHSHSRRSSVSGSIVRRHGDSRHADSRHADSRHGDSDSRQGDSDSRHGDSRHGDSDSRQGDSDARSGVSDARNGFSGARHEDSDARNGISGARHVRIPAARPKDTSPGKRSACVKEVRFALDNEVPCEETVRWRDTEGSVSEASSGSSTSDRRRKRHSSRGSRRPRLDQPGGSEESAHGLVTIRMKPDDGGKFGFNVKGGADQNLPVLVSRVAPNTPADRCYPRLNEGDQVLLINGRDVSAMTHEQVVNFIRASRECHSGELVLTVKQNVYLAEELEEPAFQYVPEALPTTVSVGVAGSQTAPLHESMLLLSEGLEAGSLVAQFEQLYRRKPGLTVTHARRPENEKKNRYRDISPYDTTRVILTYSASCEYINASYVNMEIQGSGIVNRYIACQGPLTGTCTDFWQMVWEQQSTLIVMLTTVVEQGRVKCHRYWPRLYETVDFGTLHVTCLKEEETPGFAYREFTLINTENQIERHITHMQYLAWPDHGVPDDSTEFLNFVTQVRQARTGMVEPTIVHCSAGIGRTGVLILMETAQCLIEANEPVYPLDVVRAMRDQRAMMIQTASQFRFVCEAIQRVYSEGLIKPMAEYQQR